MNSTCPSISTMIIDYEGMLYIFEFRLQILLQILYLETGYKHIVNLTDNNNSSYLKTKENFNIIRLQYLHHCCWNEINLIYFFPMTFVHSFFKFSCKHILNSIFAEKENQQERKKQKLILIIIYIKHQLHKKYINSISQQHQTQLITSQLT